MTSPVDVEGLELRECRPADYDVLLSWLPTAEDLRLFTGPALTWPVTVQMLRELAAAPGRQAFSLVEPGRPQEPLGHAELTTTGTQAHLSRVVLAPEHRGRGWANYLIVLTIAQARGGGATAMTLNVIETNQPALATYTRLDFTTAGRPSPGVLACGWSSPTRRPDLTP